MKTLFLDCGMGAAGDMLTAALFELLEDKEKFLGELNSLGLSGVEFRLEKAEKSGIVGTYSRVFVNGAEEGDLLCEFEKEHHHYHDPHLYEHEKKSHGHCCSYEKEYLHSECELQSHHHEDEHHHHEGECCCRHEGHHDDHGHDHGHHHHEHHDHHDREHHHGHHHHHSSMRDISEMIESLPLSDRVKENATAVYRLIAEAEAKAHGKEITEIHFHEVGTKDAVADVVAVCMLMEMLEVDKVLASPVHVGKGHVHCAHGILPVPAPATAHILREVPIYSTEITGELCTPTGAALLKHFVKDFGAMPMMKVAKIGYGMGKKDFKVMNCVRALLGETEGEEEEVVELSCNLDDMTAEEIGFAMEELMSEGALDVFATPIMMKKNRLATLLSVLCKPEEKEKVVRILFEHTATLGIREDTKKRYTLKREVKKINSSLGEVRLKVAEGYGVKREKFEFEDIVKLAKENNMSFEKVLKELQK